MTATVILIFAFVVLGIVYAVLRSMIAAYLLYRGKRVITCPENLAPAAVDVDAAHAALTAVLADPILRLRDCSRWPELQQCGQECLRQVESTPEECLAHTLLAKWYEGKTCVVCSKPFEEVRWHDHRPALMGPDDITIQWNQIRPEWIPEVLTTHQPVCWHCHISESFRRQHPDLVIDRPWKSRT